MTLNVYQTEVGVQGTEEELTALTNFLNPKTPFYANQIAKAEITHLLHPQGEPHAAALDALAKEKAFAEARLIAPKFIDSKFSRDELQNVVAHLILTNVAYTLVDARE